MIGYPVSLTELVARIGDPSRGGSAGWLDAARQLTAENTAAGKFVTKDKDIWGEIKNVYGILQHFKCAYCERQLPYSKPAAKKPLGAVERDVEHFRPKSNIKPWKVPAELAGDGILTQPPANQTGYFKLAYHPQNYAIACKTCNSSLKGDWFPVEGAHRSSGEQPAELLSEAPYLIFPVGDFDVDPEKLIGFRGAVPIAKAAKTSLEYRRARATITFFRLADADARTDLFIDRARMLRLAYLEWMMSRNTTADTADRDEAKGNLAKMQQPNGLHSSCVKSFVALCKSDAAAARRLAQEAAELVDSKSR